VRLATVPQATETLKMLTAADLQFTIHKQQTVAQHAKRKGVTDPELEWETGLRLSNIA